MDAASNALRRPPFAFAKRHGLIVSTDHGDTVELVCRPGISLDAVQEARRFIRRPVKLKAVSLDEFDALLQRTYEGQTGASAALTHMGVFAGVQHLYPQVWPEAANALGFVIAFAVSFAGHRCV